MAWVATAGSTTYPILNLQITKRLEGANTASFQCPANIPVGTAVTIKFNGSAVYYGKVRSIKRRTDNLNTVELMEPASDLKLFRLEDNGSGIVTIDNSLHNKRLADYIAIILDGTGWSDGTRLTTTINPVTGDPLPSIRFYNTTVAKALEKVITKICGYKMWFDNVNKRVKYGNYNTDRSAVALSTIDVRPTSSDINYNIDRVIVIGKTEDIYGEAIKSGATTPYKTLMYQYTECADSTEARSIARQILADRSVLMERFECDILPGNYIYEEGDLVRISDAKTGTYGTYGIKDIEISEEKTTLGLGCSEITIFDLLGDKLTEIPSSAFEGTQVTFSGGVQNISNNAPSEWNIDIVNVDNIDNFSITLSLDKLKTPDQLASAAAGLNADNQHLQTTGVSIGKKTTGISSGRNTTGITTLARSPYYEYETQRWWGEPTIDIGNKWGIIFDKYINFSWVAEYTLATFDAVVMDDSGMPVVAYAAWFNGTVADGMELYTWGGRSYSGGSSGYSVYTVRFTVLIPPGNKYVTWWLYANDADVYVIAWTVTFQSIRTHNHDISDAGHTTTLNEPYKGHDHNPSDPGHTVSFKNDSHTHQSPSSVTTYNKYPSQVQVFITNSSYTNQKIGTTYAGNNKTSIKLAITPYLRSGNNTIKVTSATAGSVALSGSFTSYGV
jgi:hypothetical protein